MHVRASGLALGWDRSPLIEALDDEVCDGLGVIDLGAFLPLDFALGLDPFPYPFLSLGCFILFRLPLSLLPFDIIAMPGGLIPLGILSFRLHWTCALRSIATSRATDCTSAWLPPWMILGTIVSL